MVVHGSIRQRGSKVWQVRVSLGRDPDTGRYRYAQRYVNGGKRDAQRDLADRLWRGVTGEGAEHLAPGLRGDADLAAAFIASADSE